MAALSIADLTPIIARSRIVQEDLSRAVGGVDSGFNLIEMRTTAERGVSSRDVVAALQSRKVPRASFPKKQPPNSSAPIGRT